MSAPAEEEELGLGPSLTLVQRKRAFREKKVYKVRNHEFVVHFFKVRSRNCLLMLDLMCLCHTRSRRTAATASASSGACVTCVGRVRSRGLRLNRIFVEIYFVKLFL